MEETLTWRSLLGEVIRPPLVRQRLAEELGVKPITLSRWALNISNPRPEALRSLPDAMPALQQQFITLIEQEYPNIFANIQYKAQKEQGIPAAFYARFFNDYANLPINLHEPSLHLLAIQQLIAQLDPQQRGIAVFIVQCTPPASGDHVSSLFKKIGRGTALWEEIFLYQAQLFGVESLPGNALQQAHYLMIQNSEENNRLYAGQHQEAVESRIAVPILLADRAVGCLCVYSNQSNYFASIQIDLLQAYADVLAVTFAPEDFFSFQNIKLGVIPTFEVQQPYLKTFQQRVLRHIKEATERQQLLTRVEAERLAWQDLERILLELPFSDDL
jgi:transcriptional regulator with XRE-family HTH domain